MYSLLKWIGKEKRVFKTKNEWKKFCLHLESNHSECILQQFKGGSKKHPYICIGWLDEGEANPDTKWTERNLFYRSSIFSGNPPSFQLNSAVLFNISHHAIQRFIQRGPITNATRNWKGQILEELTLIPYWAATWITIFANLKIPDNELVSISLPIPSKNGVFLCRIHKRTHVQIRTFVSDKILRPAQIILKKSLIEASRQFINSPNAFFPDIVQYGFITTSLLAIVDSVFYFRLTKAQINIPSLIFMELSSNSIKLDISQEFNNFLSTQAESIPREAVQELDEFLKDNDISTLVTEIQNALKRPQRINEW